MSTEKKEFIERNLPPVFVSGFRMGTADGVVVVDLVDNPGGEQVKVFYSIVMTKKQAISLMNGIKNIIEDKD